MADETMITAVQMVENGKDADITWMYDEFRGALGDIWTKITDRFELTRDPSTDPFQEISAGDVVGRTSGYAGPEIDWAVYSWIGSPTAGFTNMHITVHPGAQIDVPSFGLAFAAFGVNPWGYADYVPRRELMVNPEYSHKYYGSVNERWMQVRTENPDLAWFTSPTAYIRASVSPIAFLYSGPPFDKKTVDICIQQGHEYVDRWLRWVDEAEPVPAEERAALHQHTIDIRRTIADEDPANVIAERLFGKEQADGMVRALWGGDRQLPYAGL